MRVKMEQFFRMVVFDYLFAKAFTSVIEERKTRFIRQSKYPQIRVIGIGTLVHSLGSMYLSP